ncbi:protein transport protein Sec24A [Phymastichus coffea]|uniref:protein transport protein Sec24A n=1 Tax=Phymastichus coffea TaxID=108790 RepID=UPI00273BE5C6|nr:protein transport protein Sec24A [Phymastichus coffea]
MIRKDVPLTNESNNAAEESFQHGENRGIYNQNTLGSRQLNTSESMANNTGIMLNNADFPSNTAAIETNRNQTLYSSQPAQNSGPPVPNNNPPVNTNASLNSGLFTSRSHPQSSTSSINSVLSPNSDSAYNNTPIVTSGPPLKNSLTLDSGPPSQSSLHLNSGHPSQTSLLSNSDLVFNRSSDNSKPPSNSSQPLNNGPTSQSRSPVTISLQPKLGPSLQNKSSVSIGPQMSSGLQSSSGPAQQNRSPNTTGLQLSSGLTTQNRSPVSSGTQLGTLSSIGTGPVRQTKSQNAGIPQMINGPAMKNRSLITGQQSNTALPSNIGPPLQSKPSMTTGLQSNVISQQNISYPPQNRPSVAAGPPLDDRSLEMNASSLQKPVVSTGPLLPSGPQSSSAPSIQRSTVSTGLPLQSGSQLVNGPPTQSNPPTTAGPLYNTGLPLSNGLPMYSSASLNLNSLTLSGPSTLSGPRMNSGQPLLHIPPYSNVPSLHSNSLVSASSPLSAPPTSRDPHYSTGLPANNGPPGFNSSAQFRDIPLNSSSALNRNPIPHNVPMANYGPMSADSAEMRPNHLNAYSQNNQLNQYQNASVSRTGFNKMWGMDYVDLMQCRNILPTDKVSPPRIKLHQDLLDRANCSPEIFRCTLTKIPDSNSLLQKSRLPLGILIHPFKDLNHLPVIQCSSIVRCRSCRTYINPFVYFVDSKRWKCNLCFKVNELPEEFQFDPATRSYGDPSRRPEIRASTIEFIAPAEYMLRPPQPAVYLFIFDVSKLAVDSGYLQLVCNIVSEEMSKLPGDSRTQVGFIAVDSAVHFFSIQENASQPHEMVMLDIDDVFLPCPDNLIVNLREHQELVKDLLQQLSYMFRDTFDTNCALGAALQAAFKLMSPTGGRVTVFQLCLPNIGPGALTAREDPNTRAAKDVPHLNPATDFYKRLALDCSGQQIAVDLFLLNCQYSDLATLSGICKFSGGCIYYIPLFQASKLQHIEALEKMLRRYLTRKIGFEAVMRIRCTRGLSIHTFHGNFFVRSTDLLSLPNINPDAGFGMQVTIDENLSDMQHVCFQAALLYTSSRGERRIRVHTLCLPVTTNLSDVIYSADQQCIIGMLSKMAVDRSQQASLSDAREALINAVVDALSAYKLLQSYPGGGLVAPQNLKLLPMYIVSLLKSRGFRFGLSTRLDDRVFAMCQLKTLPLNQLIQLIYPDFYAVHEFVNKQIEEVDGQIVLPNRLHLSAEKLDSRGVFLLDNLDHMYLYVSKNVHPSFCYNVLGVASFTAIPEEMFGLPELDTPESDRLRTLINCLQEDKPYPATLQVIRDDGHFRTLFTERLIEDRFENALSYYEFLQHIKTQVK